jgi:hypothetical protein
MQQTVSVRALFTRAILPLAFFSALLFLPEATTDPALARVVPWFVVLTMVQLAPVMLSSRPDLFAPTISGGMIGAFGTLSAMMSFFVVGELRMEVLHTYDSNEVADLAITTLIALTVGTLAHYAGYYSRLGIGWRRLFPDVSNIDWSARRLTIVSIVPGVIFLASYWIFQQRVGVSLFNVTELAAGKATWRDDPTSTWWLRGIELGLVPALLFFTWGASQRDHRKMVLTTIAVGVVGLLVLRLGQRGPLAMGVLIAVISFHYLKRRVPIWLFLAVYYVGIVASNVMYHWRVDDPDTPRIEAVSQVVSEPTQIITTHEKERRRFATTAMILDEFPDTYPYLMGESWVGMFTTFVPRWVWPEKSEAFEWNDTRIIYKISGIPAPTPYLGVLYANFSWIGIVLGMFLFGMFHRGLYEWRSRDPQNPGTALLYGLLITFFIPTSFGLSSILQYVLPVWVLIRLMGRKAPQPQGDSSVAIASMMRS